MRGYASHIFDQRMIDYLELASAYVAAMPEVDAQGQALRCHEVARAVRHKLAAVEQGLGVSLQDGLWRAREHSWLVLWDPEQPSGVHCVLDPYSVGSLPLCQLRDWDLTGEDYHAWPDRKDIRFEVVSQLTKLAFVPVLP